MNYQAHSDEKSTFVARLRADEQNAQSIFDIVSERLAGRAAVGLADAGGGCWDVAIYVERASELKALLAVVTAAAGAKAAAALAVERIAAMDWVGASLAGLPPVAAGRFVIHGAHDRARVPPNRIGIEIEAALAFGTGHHGTTRGCLLALDRLCKGRAFALSSPRILDLGTGSGVLAIAAARALRQRVLATDVDATAMRMARANARRNRVAAMVETVQADGVNRQRLRVRAPFDLVFANILLGPLQRFAAPLKSLMAPRGRAILSGILSSQANAVLSAYRPLALAWRIDIEGWSTLVVRRV
jgi:ribosomal protein L11 methyltransferase